MTGSFMKQCVRVIIFILSLCVSIPLYANPPVVNYIVIGAGTAGAVVANRLSNRSSVIVIHNGKNELQNPLIAMSVNAFVTVPSGVVGAPFFQNGLSVPQPNLNNRQLLWMEAVPLGGGSAVNGGAYCRGTDQDYSQWLSVAGPLWSVSRINQVFVSLEKYHGQTTNTSAHGYSGPVSIYQIPNPTMVAKVFNQAIINGTGIPSVLDYNDPNTPIGSSAQMQFTQFGVNGKFRESSASAFLNSDVIDSDGNGVNGRPLKIKFESTATRILFKGQKAVGVEYYHRGKLKRVFADKGIIISAGLKSSALLLHSGIGPRSLLNRLHIPVVFDNPNVGQNLIDDSFLILGFTSNPNDTPISNGSPVILPLSTVLAEIVQSSTHRQLLKSLNIPSRLTQFSDDNGIFKQIAFLPDPAGPSNIRQFLISAINPIPGVTLALFYLVQPSSRGYVSINSRNPLAPPVINYGMLSASDLDLYIRGFQTYIPAINAALQAIDPQYQLFFPDPAIIADTAQLTEFITESVTNSMHFQGHCRMAPLSQGGVVNPHAQVYGVRHLYVADNSIVPFPMDGTPMATGYLIGENVSRILLSR